MMIEVLFFCAPWCGACRGYEPSVINAAQSMGATYHKVDISIDEALGMQYNICGLPTVVVLRDGSIAGRIDSGVTKQLVIDLIKAARED